jgi:hypothetical protein
MRAPVSPKAERTSSEMKPVGLDNANFSPTNLNLPDGLDTAVSDLQVSLYTSKDLNRALESALMTLLNSDAYVLPLLLSCMHHFFRELPISYR